MSWSLPLLPPWRVAHRRDPLQEELPPLRRWCLLLGRPTEPRPMSASQRRPAWPVAVLQFVWPTQQPNCPHPVAVAHWNNPELQDEAMLQEGNGSRYRREVLEHIETQSHLVRQYMDGSLTAPATIAAPARPLVRRKHVLPMLPRYQQQIRSGQKTVEGRLARGRALEVQAGELLQLGDVIMEVQEVIRYPNFREMLQQEGYLQALPSAQSLDEAMAEYLSYSTIIATPG